MKKYIVADARMDEHYQKIRKNGYLDGKESVVYMDLTPEGIVLYQAIENAKEARELFGIDSTYSFITNGDGNIMFILESENEEMVIPLIPLYEWRPLIYNASFENAITRIVIDSTNEEVVYASKSYLPTTFGKALLEQWTIFLNKWYDEYQYADWFEEMRMLYGNNFFEEIPKVKCRHEELYELIKTAA